MMMLIFGVLMCLKLFEMWIEILFFGCCGGVFLLVYIGLGFEVLGLLVVVLVLFCFFSDIFK